MSSAEVPLQHDMFTGEPVDPRSTSQKRKDKERERPQQAEMFSPREITQFGVNARPQLPLSPTSALELAAIDCRSEEEVEEDRMRAAEMLTYSLFDDSRGRGDKRGEMMVPTIAVFLQLLESLQIKLKSAVAAETEDSRTSSAISLKSTSSYTTMLFDGVRVIQPY